MVVAQAKKLASYIKDNKSVLLDGGIGTGKTTVVMDTEKLLLKTYTFIHISKELDLTSSESCAELLRLVKQKIPKAVYILDPMDNASKAVWNAVSTALTHAQMIIVAQDSWKAPKSVTDNTERMSLKPRASTIAKTLKIKGGVSTTDYRSAKLAAETHTSPILVDNIFERVRVAMSGNLSALNNEELPWVYDNISSYFFGKDLLKALKVLELYSQGIEEVSCCMPETIQTWGRITYPSYFKVRTRSWRSKNAVSE